MKIACRPARTKLAANAGHDLDVLVEIHAPEPPQEARRPPLCLVPVVDVSGSMAGGKLASVKHALERLVAHLVPGDRLGLVTFCSHVEVPLPAVEVTEARKADFVRLVRRLAPLSNTNLADGLLEGLRVAGHHLPEGVRARTIALTAGQANAGPATSREALTSLVRARAGAVTLSAFGYGADCDQVLLSTLADVGGGSFASIDGDDAVLTAFARELGGLVATYAADVRVRFVPLAGAPFEDRLGDLLFGGMASTGARIAVPARGNGVAIEAGEVEVRWRDALGREQREVTPLRVDYVDASEADLAELAEVVRARDERLLRIAQERAEAAAFRGDFPSAARAINEVLKSCRLMPRQLLTVEGSKPPPAPLRRVNRRIHPTRSRAQDVAAD